MVVNNLEDEINKTSELLLLMLSFAMLFYSNLDYAYDLGIIFCATCEGLITIMNFLVSEQ